MDRIEKPVVFSYRKYTEAIEENNRLREHSSVIAKRLADLEIENRILKADLDAIRGGVHLQEDNYERD